MPIDVYQANRVWKLPPLILHPFSDATSPQKLVQSSRASLMLQGLLPNESFDLHELQTILLEGRFCEVRMLFYVGKDLVRWIDQCAEVIGREPLLQGSGIEWQSFSNLLVDDCPEAVRTKLKAWGVADYRAIFGRAIGLNAVFCQAPDRTILNDDFIRNYHQFADRMFACKQAEKAFTPIRSSEFEFELFASGEYSRMLEKQWQEQ
ncbi:MAG TPA: hypothetical protein VER03_13585 [Bryobacteraceae bacterium]|nr:hypothetical protein [Bryobacteraceae bacterium]